MSTVYVTRKVHFNAAHRLHNPEQSEAWNADTYGKCNYPNWHGHNYVLEVTVAGTPDPASGYVIDLGRLKQIVHERVVDKMDHRNLNMDVDFLQGIIPSSENIVIAIWKELADVLPSGRLHQLRLYETERNFVDYFGD
ncbi:MAG: 6-carboxytetrahydropterin synthase [Rhodothermales bacterium]